MKTKFKIGIVVIILLCSIWSWFDNHEKQSEFILFNIEALANSENGNADCAYTGSVDCPFTNDKVYAVF